MDFVRSLSPARSAPEFGMTRRFYFCETIRWRLTSRAALYFAPLASRPCLEHNLERQLHLTRSAVANGPTSDIGNRLAAATEIRVRFTCA